MIPHNSLDATELVYDSYEEARLSLISIDIYLSHTHVIYKASNGIDMHFSKVG